MEDKSGRSALSQGTAITPTRVKATLASIPIATESLTSRTVSGTALCSLRLLLVGWLLTQTCEGQEMERQLGKC